jgi:hypothetical protein
MEIIDTEDYDSENLTLEAEGEQTEETETADLVPVKVVVTDVVVSQEVIPQHVSCYTIVLTDEDPVAQVLALDLLRFSARIAALDTAVVLCHSLQQAKDPANLITALGSPNGAVLPVLSAAGYVEVTSCAPLWPVRPDGENARVSVIVTRRSV